MDALQKNYTSFLKKQLHHLSIEFPNKHILELIESHALMEIQACLNAYVNTVINHKTHSEKRCMEVIDEIKSFTELSNNKLKVYFEGRE